MNIFKELKSDIKKYASIICDYEKIWDKVTLEVPKDILNGDLSTNIAMLVAAQKKKDEDVNISPREIALQFKEHLQDISYLAHIEIAGPGFINFTIKAQKWHESIKSIIADDKNFWKTELDKVKNINLEYVSANPTGPMHIGHARGAVFGDVLANILLECGHKVTKEYYINDAGSQIDILFDSFVVRYTEIVKNQQIEIPSGMYPGEYLIDVATKIYDKYGSDLLFDKNNQLKTLKIEEKKSIKKILVDEMMNLIKNDLRNLNINHDIFFSENQLHENKDIDKTINILNDKGLIYRGILPPPKGHITDADKEEYNKEQLLFASTKYGDMQDRPIEKAPGVWSYLAADFAYAQNKISRKFNELIYVLGADHIGYVKRIEAAIHALSDEKVKPHIITNQLVNFVKSGKPYKMSKRKGTFMTVQDVVNEVGKDIVRFMMITRKSDIVIDFDFDKVKEQSKNNPVFYVQYAYVRANSIINNAKETCKEAYDIFNNELKGENNNIDLSVITSEEEIHLIKLLSSWSRILEASAKFCQPHRLAYYLIDIASVFHSIWHLGKLNNQYRFNIQEDSKLTSARLMLALATQKIIKKGFDIIGITALEKM